MYMVVSKWEALPGHENDWRQQADATRQKLLAIPGVEFSHRFVNEQGQVVVAMAYTDEATYRRLVDDPNGAVAKAMAESNIESYARWISSERGETEA